MEKASESMSREERIIATALKKFKLCVDAEAENRKLAKDDIDFRSGEQWPDDIKNNRQINKRPCITINKMPQFERQIINDQKQNSPSIKVRPVDSEADKETAEVLQGLIRNIENQSDAEEAYDKAFTSAVRGAFGFWTIYTDYENEESFNLEAKIGMIDNPFNVYLDPYSVKVDGSDASYGFIVDKMTREDFINEFGKSKLAKHIDWDDIGKDNPGWCSSEEVRIAEYYFKDIKRVKIYLLSDGKTYKKEQLPEMIDDGYIINGEFLTVLKERYSQECVVKWIKMNAIEILEETDWPGTYIPIVPVYGDIINVEGKVIRESMIRHAKDSQRMVNFWASSEAEAITLAPKAPFIGYEGQFEGHENKWDRSNMDNFAYLEVKPTTLGSEDTILPLPQRNQFEPPVMAINQARALANQDLKETTGVPDATRGMASDEKSGIAIQRRVNQGLTSNFHLVDNLNKSIKHTGRILVEIIPKIYDSARTIRILGESKQEDLIAINRVMGLPEGQKRPYNFSYGKYDVSVSAGPSYETKRQEARDTILELISGNPQLASIASDLLVQNMDIPNADEIADRIRKTMDPKILSKGDEQIPPAIVAQMEQLTGMVEQLTQQLNAAHDQLENDSMKIESDERIASMKIKADLEKELIKIQGKEGEIVLKQQIDMLNRRLDSLGMGEPIEQEQNEYNY